MFYGSQPILLGPLRSVNLYSALIEKFTQKTLTATRILHWSVFGKITFVEGISICAVGVYSTRINELRGRSGAETQYASF